MKNLTFNFFFALPSFGIFFVMAVALNFTVYQSIFIAFIFFWYDFKTECLKDAINEKQ